MMRALRYLAPALLLLPGAASATPFTFSTYDSMVADLQALAAAHPNLTDLYTAQDRFGLPTIPEGGDDLETWILRIANEQMESESKAEILLVGVQHGDEVVSLDVCLEIARLLLENHASATPNPWLKTLVDRREIYIMPMANPWGHRRGVRGSPGAEGTEDMNRDHLYDRCDGGGFCGDDEALSTVGAQAIHELARRHNFRVMLDYHGGIELIIHPWGSPLHFSDTESPDDRGHDLLGQRMSDYGGNFNGAYPVGTSNDLLGPVNSPLDDTAYATGWDPANAATEAAEVPGWRALSYTVEISNQKRPPVSTLGGDADLLTPGGSEDGYVPKNVRIGLAAIDSIEPWIEWTNRDAIPTSVAVGDTITLEWSVRGCFQVDETRVRFGAAANPLTTFDDQTAAQQQTTGDPCWLTPRVFTADVTFQNAGQIFVTPVAQVDNTLLMQNSPDPNVAPAAWLARSRTENGLLITNTVDPNETSTIVGRTFWGAAPLEISVGDGVIFADGFESGGTTAWTITVP